MEIVYRTGDSIEADKICNILSEHGIEWECNRNDSFHVISGVNQIMFEISVPEDMKQLAQAAIREQSLEQESVKTGSSRRNRARVLAILSLIIIVIGVAASIISAVM